MRGKIATGKIPVRAFLILTLFFLLVAGTSNVRALTTLTLSDYSSNTTSADLLDATLGFSVAGSTLTLDVTNLTGPAGGNPEGFQFDISEIYFNIGAGITDLTFSDTLWDLTLSSNSLGANGFGLFDVSLVVSNVNNSIVAGVTKTFVIGIVGTGSEEDFTTYASAPQDSDLLSLAAAKFIRGPDDDSAYGNVIPEPMTVGLLGLGALLLRRKGRG